MPIRILRIKLTTYFIVLAISLLFLIYLTNTPAYALVIRGTPGNDNLSGTPKNDSMEGLRGDDNIVGLGGNDVIEGSQGKDILKGSEGNDYLNGGQDNDAALWRDWK